MPQHIQVDGLVCVEHVLQSVVLGLALKHEVEAVLHSLAELLLAAACAHLNGRDFADGLSRRVHT